MAHFFGSIEGNRGKATRLGSRDSGMSATAAGWKGAIKTRIYHEEGVDHYVVELIPWQSSGGNTQVLARGVLNATLTQDKAASA